MSKQTPFIEKKPSSLRYFQEGPAPIDLDLWRLDITGIVKRPVSLTYKELMSLPVVDHHRRTVCVCLWSIRRHWEGARLSDVLMLAGVDAEDRGLFLRQTSTGTDKGVYESTIHMKSALLRDSILAYRVDDLPLSLECGFPLRLIDFGLYQYKCVKALRTIEITRENRLGHWEELAGYSIDGTVRSKKYYVVDLQRKFFFAGTGEVLEHDIR